MYSLFQIMKIMRILTLNMEIQQKIDLYLRNKIEYDIISIDEAIFFSEKIVEELKENNATGYRIVDGILNI